MIDKTERRKFLKAALAAMAIATGVGSTSCHNTRGIFFTCYKPANLNIDDNTTRQESKSETNDDKERDRK